MADKKVKNTAWTKITDGFLPDATKKINAIDFIEGPGGTSIVLRPVQRVLVKALFAVPFDYRPKWADAIDNWGMVEMWNPFRDELIRTVTEEEYLHIVHEEGRCNVGDWRDIPERGFNEAVIFCGRRGGKALALDEFIPTPNGFVRNGDIRDGDVVLSANGRPTKVVYAHPSFESHVYRVTFDDGTSVLTHPEHRWYTYTKQERKNINRCKIHVFGDGLCACGCGLTLTNPKKSFRHGHRKSRQWTGSVRTTEEIRATLLAKSGRKTQSNHSVPLSKPVELSERNLSIDPYLLGTWLGDGSADRPAITTNDLETIEFCYAAAASYGLGIHVDQKVGTDCSTYRLTTGKAYLGCAREGRNPFLSALRDLGVFKNKHIPFDYLWASADQRLALLQGLMDTDGCCAEDGRVEFCNMNKTLAEGVYHLAASLGLKPFWGDGIATVNGKDCGTKYRVTWTASLPVFRLPRKLARLPKQVKDTQNWRYIVSVEPAGTQTVRCLTVEDPDGLFLFGKNFNVTHNSEAVAAIAAYKLYLTLCINSPQKFFGLAEGSKIDFTFLAQDETGAGRLFQKLQAAVTRATWFHTYIKDNNAKNLTFTCEADRHHKVDAKPSVQVVSLPCTTNAVRGPSSLFLALDEFAHFRSEVGSTSEDMYDAATPAAGDFHHDELAPLDEANFHQAGNFKHAEPVGTEGRVEVQDSLILSISSPLKKVGMMYDLYRMAMDDGINEDNPTFALSCSSAEMNPKLKAGFLRDKARKNPLTFKAEYGGQFLESTESFVRSIDIITCTDVLVNGKPEGAWDNMGEPIKGASVRQNTTRFTGDQVGYNYFWGLDLGGVNVTDPDNTRPDGCALAIGHLEVRPSQNPTPGLTHGFHLVFDYIDRMIAGEQFDGPGVDIHTPDGVKYTDFQLLPVKDILLWLKEMNKILPCFKGSTDQHAGRQLVTLLEQNEINNMELVNLTPAINSEMAYALRSFINDHTANFPYVPKFIHEIKMVETDVVAKYRIRVHAPLEKGAHDDMVDAVMLVALQVQKWLVEEGHLKMDPTGQSLIMQRQQALPHKPILNIDAMSMSDLKAAERTYQMSKFKFGGGSHRVSRGRGRRF